MSRATMFEAGTIAELSRLVETVRQTRREQVLLLAGTPAARLVPLRHAVRRRSMEALVDTSALPPVPESRLEELLTRAPGAAPHSFTDAEIREAVEIDRAEAWHTKHG